MIAKQQLYILLAIIAVIFIIILIVILSRKKSMEKWHILNQPTYISLPKVPNVGADIKSSIGKLYNIKNLDLLDSSNPFVNKREVDVGKSIYESFKIFTDVIIPADRKTTILSLDNTNQIIDNFSRSIGLKVQFPISTVAASGTLKYTTSKENIHKSNIVSVIADYHNYSRTLAITDDDCYTVKFNQQFMTQLDALLKVDIKDPNDLDQWTPFIDFLDEWGTHVLTTLKYGCKYEYNVTCSSDISSSEIIKALQVGVAINVASKDVGGPSYDYDKRYYQLFQQIKKNIAVMVRGGGDAGNYLLAHPPLDPLGPSGALKVQDFLNNGSKECANCMDACYYAFRPIWEILWMYKPLEFPYTKLAYVLEAAYYINILKNDITLSSITQKIESHDSLDIRTSKTVTLYNVHAFQTGCRSNDSCKRHSGIGGCYCEGSNCVDKTSIGPSIPNTNDEETVYASSIKLKSTGNYDEGVNASCETKGVTSCECKMDWANSDSGKKKGGLPERNLWNQTLFGKRPEL